MKESYFVSKYINPLLEEHLVWFMNTTIDTTKFKGFPDIIGQTKSGKVIGLEIKNETRLAEIEQVEWVNKIKSNNGYAFIVFADQVGRTKIGDKAKQNRIDKGYTPFTEFKEIIKEINEIDTSNNLKKKSKSNIWKKNNNRYTFIKEI